MKDFLQFGIPTPEFRTDYGTLKTRELEKIICFLNKRGVLIADCFDRKAIIVHPTLVDGIQREMTDSGFYPLLIGSTVSNLRKNENLSLAQNRVLEALTPGALIINRNNISNSDLISVAIPDNTDLRDICSSYEGFIRVFITKTKFKENELIEILGNMKLNGLDVSKMGILEYPYYDEPPVKHNATIADVFGPNQINIIKLGVYDLDTIKQASVTLSQYEMGGWT